MKTEIKGCSHCGQRGMCEECGLTIAECNKLALERIDGKTGTTQKKGFSMGYETYPNVAPSMPVNQMFWRQGKRKTVAYSIHQLRDMARQGMAEITESKTTPDPIGYAVVCFIVGWAVGVSTVLLMLHNMVPQ